MLSLLLITTTRASPIPLPVAQIEQATTLANNILQAQLGQVIGLVLVSITLVLAVFAVIFFRIINVVARQTDAMAKKTENDSKVIENMQITNRAIEHLANGMDEQTLLLARIDDGMKENVALNTERNLKSDGMSVDIRATLTEVTALAKDTSEGRRSAVDEIKTTMSQHFEAQSAEFTRVITLLKDAITELSDKQTAAAVVTERVESKLDEALTILKERSTNAPPPEAPAPTTAETGDAPKE